MNPSLSFSGKAPQNFLNDEFMLLLFGRNKDKLKKSLPSPYFKQKIIGILEKLQNKKPVPI